MLFAGVLVTASGGGTSTAARWAITDLGTVGDGHFGGAQAINDRGQVIGIRDLGASIHGFLWQKGTTTDLGTLGGQDSGVVAINESGQVIGGATRSLARGTRSCGSTER